MDNILKLLLGVLSVAGLIAMVTPTNMTVAPPVPVVADMPAVAGPDQLSDAALLPEEEIVEEAEDDPFSTGEPMIDGNPIGQPVANNSEGDSQQQSPPSYDPAAYGIPNMTEYSPPPVYNMPNAVEASGQVFPAQ